MLPSLVPARNRRRNNAALAYRFTRLDAAAKWSEPARDSAHLGLARTLPSSARSLFLDHELIHAPENIGVL